MRFPQFCRNAERDFEIFVREELVAKRRRAVDPHPLMREVGARRSRIGDEAGWLARGCVVVAPGKRRRNGVRTGARWSAAMFPV